MVTTSKSYGESWIRYFGSEGGLTENPLHLFAAKHIAQFRQQTRSRGDFAVFDYGCGTGALHNHLTALGLTDFRYVCIDGNTTILNVCRNRLTDQAECRLCNLSELEEQSTLEFDSEPSDFVALIRILNNLPDPACNNLLQRLAAIHRGCHFLIIEPFFGGADAECRQQTSGPPCSIERDEVFEGSTVTHYLRNIHSYAAFLQSLGATIDECRSIDLMHRAKKTHSVIRGTFGR